MRNNQIKAGSVLSYAQMFLNILISLIYTPLMIRLLGQSEYGLYNTVASTIAMLSVLNLGFSSGYIRYYARYKARDDTEAIAKLNGLFLIIFCGIALVAAVCGAYLSTHLELVFKDGLTQEEYRAARTLMWLLTFNLSVSFPMSVFSTIISAHEEFVFLKLVGMGKSVLSPLLTIPLLLLGYGSVGIVVVTVFVSLGVDCAYVYYSLVKLRQRFVFYGFEKGIFRSLFSYTVFIAVNILIDQINWNIDKLLLGRYLGTGAVAVYTVGATLQTYYNMFSRAVSGVFTPRIHAIMNKPRLSEKERDAYISDLFLRVGRIQFMILALICSGFVFFGKSFIKKWAGPGYDGSYYVAVMLMIPVTIPLIQNLGIEIQRARNLHHFRSVAYLIMAIINLVMTIYLCPRYGPVGAAVGTAVSLIFANGIVMNIYYQKKIGIDIIRFWKSILQILLGLAPSLLIGLCIYRLADTHSWPRLIGWGAAYAACYSVCLWFLSMKPEEQNLLRRPVKKILQRF